MLKQRGIYGKTSFSPDIIYLKRYVTILHYYRMTVYFIFIFHFLLYTIPFAAAAQPLDEIPEDFPSDVSGETPLTESPDQGAVFTDNMSMANSSLVIRLKYLKADQVKTILASLMQGEQVRVESMNNMLIVLGNADACNQVKNILAQIDIPPRQVMFEAEVVEISRADLKKIGIDWGSLSAMPGAPVSDGSAFRIGLGIGHHSQYGINVQVTVNRLLENKKGRLLASPRIAATDGQTARILIGDRLAVESSQIVSGSELVSVNYVDVGIKLEVTPSVHEDGTISTYIKPEVSNKTDSTKSGNPNIRTRQAETTLRVKSGETIVLGGLIQREETSDAFKVPLLGNIPLIGQLFRSTSREKKETELIILITPKIMDLPNS